MWRSILPYTGDDNYILYRWFTCRLLLDNYLVTKGMRHLRKIRILPKVSIYGCSLYSGDHPSNHDIFPTANQWRAELTRVMRYYCTVAWMKRVSLSMLPFETDVLLGEVTKNCYRVMPKVVPDQRSKFDNDELFRKLSREGEVVSC